MKTLVSIVIPAYNEELVIPELTRRLIKIVNTLPYQFEIIIVENGSSDRTLEKLLEARKKDKRIKVLQLAKNAMCDGGIVAGLSYAQGECAIVMMADLQDIPELIPQFLKKWKEGYDIVNGVVTKRVNMRLTRRFGTFVFYKLMSILTNGSLPENVSDFRLVDKKVYSLVIRLPEHHTFFRGLVNWSGFKQTGISFDRPDRFAGESKADFKTALTVAVNGIIAFSSIPLRSSWVLVFLLFLLSVGSVFINVFLGIILFAILVPTVILAIIGEYVLRMYDEVRQRPQFIVQNMYGLKTPRH